jgi:Zn-dependent protease with chaperone function
VFWSLLLAGRGRVVASLGTGLFILLASSERQSVRWLRYLLSFGVEPVALAASRHADRLEELQADRYAAQIVDPETLTEALYRVAAVATGDNMEDVAGPIPWDADRSLRFGLFATHPSIETRAAHLDCTIPAWARPYRPHRSEQAPA